MSAVTVDVLTHTAHDAGLEGGTLQPLVNGACSRPCVAICYLLSLLLVSHFKPSLHRNDHPPTLATCPHVQAPKEGPKPLQQQHSRGRGPMNLQMDTPAVFRLDVLRRSNAA